MDNATNSFLILKAEKQHIGFAQQICDEMESSAKERGTGIAKRTPEYIIRKMLEGKAVIALAHNGTWAGFCYIEAWENKNFVANSGLIVAKPFRKSGLARMIKQKIFELSRKKYPNAKIFGLTTGLAVMKINSELGYVPVTYSELTSDEKFWDGCKSCVNHDILTSKNFKNCLCTGMLFDPNEKKTNAGSNLNKMKDENTGKQNIFLSSRLLKRSVQRLKSAVRHSLNSHFSLSQEESSKVIG